MLIKIIVEKGNERFSSNSWRRQTLLKVKFELAPLVGEGNVGKGQRSKGITS